MSEGEERGTLREIRRILFGLGFSLLAIVAFAFVFLYLVPVYFSSPGREWSGERSATVSLNYPPESSPAGGYEPFLEELTETRAEVVDKLELDPEEVPDRVHVYLHPNLDSLKRALSVRKSSSEVDVPLATMDVIEGRAAEPVLVRLLSAFTWGRPGSEFLRLGLGVHFSGRYEEVHARAAALGEGAFSLEEVTFLERTTGYLKSLQARIYDTYDSPHASAGLDLAGLSSLTRLEQADRPYRYELEVQAGSFVSYLLAEFGPSKLREVWRAGSLEEGLREALDSTVSEVESVWRNYAAKEAEGKPGYDYFRARALFGRGKLPGARRRLDGLEGGKVPKEEVAFLKGRVEFYAGDWEEARASFNSAGEASQSEARTTEIRAYRELLNRYESGTARSSGRLYLFSPGSSDVGEKTVREVFRPWERAKEKLPSLNWDYSRFVVLLAGEDRFTEEAVGPDWVTFPRKGGEPSKRVAQLLVRGAMRVPSYSSLLRRGLVRYLAGDEVFSGAARVLEAGRWSPLDGLTFDGEGEEDSVREAAAFVGYLLEEFGEEKFLEVWRLSTPLGGERSLEYALQETTGMGLDEIESELKGYLRG